MDTNYNCRWQKFSDSERKAGDDSRAGSMHLGVLDGSINVTRYRGLVCYIVLDGNNIVSWVISLQANAEIVL
jgi:hypothetical protein